MQSVFPVRQWFNMLGAMFMLTNVERIMVRPYSKVLVISVTLASQQHVHIRTCMQSGTLRQIPRS